MTVFMIVSTLSLCQRNMWIGAGGTGHCTQYAPRALSYEGPDRKTGCYYRSLDMHVQYGCFIRLCIRSAWLRWRREMSASDVVQFSQFYTGRLVNEFLSGCTPVQVPLYLCSFFLPTAPFVVPPLSSIPRICVGPALRERPVYRELTYGPNDRALQQLRDRALTFSSHCSIVDTDALLHFTFVPLLDEASWVSYIIFKSWYR